MAARPVLVTLAVVAGLAVVLTAAPTRAVPPGPSIDVVLPDGERTVAELVDIVRAAARGVPGAAPDRDLRIELTDSILDDDQRPFVAGLQYGETVSVRIVGIAMPTRTLLHEVAHALAPPAAGHGDTFRAVYLTAIEEVYDGATAAREARRLAWVYDKCYLDDSCPQVPRHGAG